MSTAAEESGTTDRADVISYADWGVDFFREAITAERVAGAVRNLSGQPIEFGPMGVGPGRLAKIAATGSIGEAKIAQVSDDPVSYRLLLPVALAFEVNLQVETHRFTADLEVPLVLTARALTGLRIKVDITPPRSRDVVVSLTADGLRASITQRVANVEVELKRFVAKYVAREIAKPHIADATVIDVAGAIAGAYATIAPQDPATPAAVADLNDALKAEIRANEGTLLDGD